MQYEVIEVRDLGDRHLVIVRVLGTKDTEYMLFPGAPDCGVGDVFKLETIVEQ